MSHAHKRKLCRFCRGVIEQCRCMEAGKTTTWGACDECLVKVANGQQLKDRSDSGPGGALLNALESLHAAVRNAQDAYRHETEGAPYVARQISLSVARDETKAALLYLDAKIKEAP